MFRAMKDVPGDDPDRSADPTWLAASLRRRSSSTSAMSPSQQARAATSTFAPSRRNRASV